MLGTQQEKPATTGSVSSQGSGEHEKQVPQDAGAVEKQAAPAAINPWDPAAFPDGGADAWLNVAGSSALLFVSFGWINTIGIWQDYYSTHQLSQYTQSEVSWIASAQVFFMLVCGLPIGVLFDRIGSRIPLMIGTFLHVFGIMMTSLCKEYYQFFLAQAMCSAIGASLAFNLGINCTVTWFHKKRGAAMGLVAAGSSLGGVILPIMIVHLIPEVGFGWAMRICGFFILALMIFANFTVKSRLPPAKRPFSFTALFKPFSEARFSITCAAVFFLYWSMFVPFTYIVVEARAYGMSERLAYYLVPILNGASIVGRTVPNAIADKIGKFNMMIITTICSTIVLLALWLPSTGNAPLIVFAALFGITSGAGIGLSPTLPAQISELKDIGLRTGALISTASLAALTGSPIAGAILGAAHYDFKYPIVFSGVSMFVAVCLFITARIVVGGSKLKAKV